MNKKTDPVVTESVLDEGFEKFEDRIATRIVAEITYQLDKAKREIDENARTYRDQILTREDKTVGELEEHRVERLALKNDVTNLTTRVAKLEQSVKAM